MRRISQLIKLLPECKDDYVLFHKTVWPGVLATIQACHIHNYSIFLYDDLLIAYFEYHGEDYEADMRRMAADPETQRWWAIMDPMQKPLINARKGETWSQVDEVFHFDAL